MTALALFAILQANSDLSTPIFASIHSRGRTAKSGTGVTEITPVPKNLNFAFFDKRQEAFRSLFLLPLHREHRHALQTLDLHAERAASGGENLPVVGNERLRAGDVRARQVDDDLSGAAVDERHGAGVFGLFAECILPVFVFADHAQHSRAGRDIRTFAGFQHGMAVSHGGHGFVARQHILILAPPRIGTATERIGAALHARLVAVVDARHARHAEHKP